MDIIKNVLGLNSQKEHPIVVTSSGKIWLDILVHVQDIGDTKIAEGHHLISFPLKRIEGFEISHSIPDVQIKYMAHIENQGDTEWKSTGHFVGTRGRSARLEGIAIVLEGKAAPVYDIKYYVQMHGIASSPIAQNGEFAGTRGESRRVEGLAVWIEPKQILIHPEQADKQHVPYESYNLQLPYESNDIEIQYELKCRTPSDIHEHLLTLYRYSLGCTVIAEFGVRSVVSTWAFLRGLRDTNVPYKKLISCDLERSPNVALIEAAAANNNIEFEFIKGNDLTVDLKGGVDLLFIDTWHVYPQLKKELEMHSPNVRKYIAMHDTTIDAEIGESIRCGFDIAAQAKESGYSEQDIKTGLRKALTEFLATHSEWKTKEVFTNNNGLTILERI